MNITDAQTIKPSHALREDHSIEPTAKRSVARARHEPAPARGKDRPRGKGRGAAAAGSVSTGSSKSVHARGRSKPTDQAHSPTNTADDCAPRAGTKLGQVVALLHRKSGAGIADLIAATGWQPHTVRAVLTGLRKRGIAVVRDQDRHGKTIYRIAKG